MKKVFQSMDTDFDGKLTKEEIVEGLQKINHKNAEEEAERIFSIADLDENGTLEFTEWCTATMDKRKMLGKGRL